LVNRAADLQLRRNGRQRRQIVTNGRQPGAVQGQRRVNADIFQGIQGDITELRVQCDVVRCRDIGLQPELIQVATCLDIRLDGRQIRQPELRVQRQLRCITSVRGEL